MDHDTPLGTVRIRVDVRGLRAICWPECQEPLCLDFEDPNDTGQRIVIDLCRCCLDAYFARQWDHFRQLRERIPFDLSGTFFQRRVWATLYSLPRLRISYTEFAGLLGRPRAARAVGNALGANPIPILLPCHRVLAADGLGGYSGGTERKLWLLEHEKIVEPTLIPVARPDLFTPSLQV